MGYLLYQILFGRIYWRNSNKYEVVAINKTLS